MQKNLNIHRSIQAVPHSNAVEAGSNSYSNNVQMSNVQKYIYPTGDIGPRFPQ
jgi:hypothetical protein